MLAMAQGMTFK